MFRVFALSMILMSLCWTAVAGTVQKVRFAQTGKVLVWVDGVMVGQGAAVSLGASETSIDPIFGNGMLEPIGATSAEGVHRIVFSVASNTGFVLETGTALKADEVSVRILAEGENARAVTRIPGDGSRRIFEQTDRTARGRGAPITQSLTLEVISTGGALDGLTITASDS
ncbi:MAG: hypothetical protein HRT80_00310 [Henriciella sp.]|nr:hypothetical protein [Henriciella sp.]